MVLQVDRRKKTWGRYEKWAHPPVLYASAGAYSVQVGLTSFSKNYRRNPDPSEAYLFQYCQVFIQNLLYLYSAVLTYVKLYLMHPASSRS